MISLSGRLGGIVPHCCDRLRSFAAALRRVSQHRLQAGLGHAPATAFAPSTGGCAQLTDTSLVPACGFAPCNWLLASTAATHGFRIAGGSDQRDLPEMMPFTSYGCLASVLFERTQPESKCSGHHRTNTNDLNALQKIHQTGAVNRSRECLP